jgi:membrane-associated protease RseP (regulator of RpoE activity)
MAFIIYDLILLGLFVISISLFLYKKRKNLKKEGLLFLYKTPWGLSLINKVGEKYPKTLKVMSYVSIFLGYILMIFVLYFILKIVWIYIFNLELVKAIKVPPIMPIVPYIDKIVPGLPSFYFIYWVIILALIAIPHEFAHGIYSIYNKIKVKSTGFGFFPFFFPVFLAAFVELDEKKMQKQKIYPQLTILSAGTFANMLTAIFFIIIMILFFSFTFEPAGIIFDDYAYSAISLSTITMVGNTAFESPTYEEILNLKNYTYVKTKDKEYFAIKDFLDKETILVYENSPAIQTGLKGAILSINGKDIKNIQELKIELDDKKVNEKIEIITKTNEGEKKYEITLDKNPFDEKKPWLGIVFESYNSEGIAGKIVAVISSFKDKNIYYSSKFGDICIFIYDLLWWIILISISVALINMLPVGIFDGGRFFYLTILGLTKNEKIARKSFSLSTTFFLLLLFLVMFAWFISFFR